MKKQLLMGLMALSVLSMNAQENRALWASINNRSDATIKAFKGYNKIVLVSWRLLPTDSKNVAFDLYRTVDGVETKVNTEPIVGVTNYQDKGADKTKANTYRLTYAGKSETLDTYTISQERVSSGLPYISIPLTSTTDIHTNYQYEANDVSVGDVDGDGEYEIILKRLLNYTGESGTDDPTIRHTCLLECYKLDGTMLWRLKSGPNIILGNSWSFAVADFNGDGKAEVAVRTSEGTVFGDGTEIGDVDGDGITYYRKKFGSYAYIGEGPEFISVLDGTTGKELARAPYINRDTSESWGTDGKGNPDTTWKRSCSYRIAAANVSGENPSVIICRGVYGRSVLEAWDLSQDNQLTKRWRFDTENDGYADWASQGYHSLSVGDVDDDGFDEIVYGSMTVDHDGSGLNNSGLGHGDALHLGKFRPDLDGLQIWSCFETGTTNAALRDAKTGEVIWDSQASQPSDCGRAMVGDIDPTSPGCEMWFAGGNAYSSTGEDLGYKPSSCNMGIWFSGSLNRQLLDGTTIDAVGKGTNTGGRVFTLHRYNVTYINSTKKNPSWYGDILGDWREEVILPTSSEVENPELRIFSTWYPCEYAYPWLMTDHVYEMSAINQNIGYNQPTHLGYYLGSDTPGVYPATTGIKEVKNEIQNSANGKWYNLMGVEVTAPSKGIYIHNGKKVVLK